nr:SPFH domain-containing protein [uncultured Dethiosulfovibrio sp.]
MISPIRSLGRQGAVVAIIMASLGALTSGLSGISLGFAPVVFLVASVIPWISVVYQEARGAGGGLEDFDGEWRVSVTALVSGVLGLFSLSGLIGYSGGLPSPQVLPSSVAFPLSLLVPLGGWVSLVYFRSIMDHSHGPLIPCIDYLRGSVVAGVGLSLIIGLSFAGMLQAASAVAEFVLWFQLIISLELILSLAMEWYRPSGSSLRWPYGSRILGLLSPETSLREVLEDIWRYQFGVELSRSGALRWLIRDIPLLLSFSFLCLLGISCLFSVPEGYRAVVMRWGEPVRVADPGIGLKAPWPMDLVHMVDVGSVRRIHVGSHRPATDDGDIYKRGAPILWTNDHGLQSEHYIPVAPPADVAQVVAGRRIPSVSFVGADIFAEYRIVDPLAFVKGSTDGVEILKQRAERASSRIFVRYDVDSIVGEGRVEAAMAILDELRLDSDLMDTGLAVDYIGIVGVHPPQGVASFFEENVSAIQERETSIQWAIQAAVLRMTETVGNEGIAESLLEAIDSGDGEKIDALLLKCGGTVAWELGKALEYRVLKESVEGVRADSFLSRYRILQAAPLYYRESMYLDVLDSALPRRRKYVVPRRRDDLLFRLSGLAPAVSLPSVGEEMPEIFLQE